MPYHELYQQSNYHLVESDKKRDQVIVFYTAVVGAFIAVAKVDSQTAGYFMLALAILGFLLGALVVQYRKWHLRYVNSGRVLVHLAINPDYTDQKSIEALRALIDEDMGIAATGRFTIRPFLRRYLQGVEVLTYQAFLVVAFIPIQVSIRQANLGIPIQAHWAVPFMINLFLYILLMNTYAICYLYRDFSRQTPFALWVLPGLIHPYLRRPPKAVSSESRGSSAA